MSEQLAVFALITLMLNIRVFIAAAVTSFKLRKGENSPIVKGQLTELGWATTGWSICHGILIVAMIVSLI